MNERVRERERERERSGGRDKMFISHADDFNIHAIAHLAIAPAAPSQASRAIKDY
jgi:hypothetical protein